MRAELTDIIVLSGVFMTAKKFDFALAIGGAAGQGIATPGNILAAPSCAADCT